MHETYIPQSSEDPTIFDNKLSWSEYWSVPDRESIEVTAPALLLDRDEYNRIWNEEKQERRRANEALRHNVFDHGTYYINGVGQPRG